MANKNTTRKTVARRNRKNIEKGLHTSSLAFNNTIVTITDAQEMLYLGEVLEN